MHPLRKIFPYCFLFFLIFCSNLVATEMRGFKVGVKSTNNEVEQVQLYQGSYALLIGVSNYTGGWPSLGSIPAELESVERLLLEAGFMVEKHMDPDHKRLPQLFETFIDRYGYNPENRLLFFYSGHGHSRKNGSKGYLVPTDAPNPVVDDVGFVQKAVGMHQILSWARDIEAKHALFLFDSCFSGTIFKQKNLPKPPKHITNLTTMPVRQFITAGRAGETVPAKSTFTPAFIDGLQYSLADLNGDGYVSGTELGLYLQETVPKHTDQSPQFGKINDYELSRGDFVFRSGRTSSSSTVENTEEPIESKFSLLKISSFPTGATVHLNDQFFGKTPLQLDKTEPGKVRISVSKKGYLSQEQKIMVSAGRRTVLNFNLQQKYNRGSLRVITEPVGAKVRLINSPQSYSPGVQLTANRYQVSVTAAGYKEGQQWVQVNEGDDVIINVKLDRSNTVFPLPTKTIPTHTGDISNVSSYIDPTVGMSFVLIDGGCFEMGNTYGNGYADETPVHTVCVDDFYMAKYEVTQKEYMKVMGNNPSKFTTNENLPVEQVSWQDSQLFVNKLSLLSKRQYRLPSEAEWEFAARSGGKREIYSGSNNPDPVAWYSGNSNGTTHRVGTKSANGLGIYDMSGNVWEWCQDWYRKDYYAAGSRMNPIGPEEGKVKVIRGSSWEGYPGRLRASSRFGRQPTNRYHALGLRLVFSKE